VNKNRYKLAFIGVLIILSGFSISKVFFDQSPDCKNQNRMISPSSISPGEILEFNKYQSGMTCGWGDVEAWGTWTTSQVAALDLKVLNNSSSNLKFELAANPFIFGEHVSVSSQVYANGKEITRLNYNASDIGGKKTFTIPSEAKEDGTLHLVFVISEPAAPVDLKVPNSTDVRKLGLGFVSIKLVS
jgi:hypothetical protein